MPQPDAHHDDVIIWKYLPRYWPFMRGIHRSSVNSPHKGQWHEALMFFSSAPEPTVQQTMEKLVTWDATALIMTSLLWLWDIIVFNGWLWSRHSEIMARVKVIPSIISSAINSTYRYSSSTVAHRPRCIFVSWESFILVSATPGTYIFNIFSIHCARNSGANYPRWLSFQVELQMHLSQAHNHLGQMP